MKYDLIVTRDSDKDFARSISLPVTTASFNQFLDTETQLQLLAQVKDASVLMVWRFSFAPDDRINDQMYNSLLLAGKLKQLGAAHVATFYPYFPYARQDKSEEDTATLGLVAVTAHLLKGVGVREVITCDLHAPAVIGALAVPVHDMILDQRWIDFLQGEFRCTFGIEHMHDLVLASPDKGGIERVQRIATALGVEFVSIKKRRIGADRSEALSLSGVVTGKVVVLIDDIIDTAGTAINACHLLRDRGARDIIGCFTHGVLSGPALSRIAESCFSRVFITNTICQEGRQLSDKISVLSIDSYVSSLLSQQLS